MVFAVTSSNCKVEIATFYEFLFNTLVKINEKFILKSSLKRSMWVNNAQKVYYTKFGSSDSLNDQSCWEISFRKFSRSKYQNSDGRTLNVPNLIRGEKKYHPLKQGNKVKTIKVTKPGYSCFDLSVICVLLWQGGSWGDRDRDIWTK